MSSTMVITDDTNKASLNVTFMLICAMLAFFMQVPLAMYEAGSCSLKNTKSCLLKNLVNLSVTVVMWTVCGYYMAYPGPSDAPVSPVQPFMTEEKLAAGQYCKFFFEWTFCAIMTTIAISSMDERVEFKGQIISAAVISGGIYPFMVRFCWGGRTLVIKEDREDVYTDVAGAGLVHMSAGIIGLVGAWMTGARKGRFEAKDEEEEKPFFAASSARIVAAALMMLLSMYGCVAGTVSNVAAYPMVAVRAVTVMTLGMGAAGLSSLLITVTLYDALHMQTFCGGVVAGMVSMCAGAHNMDTPEAIATGAAAGAVFVAGRLIMGTLKIDDPVNAFAVHGLPGLLGVSAQGFFDMDKGMWSGDGAGVDQLFAQLRGALFIIIVSFGGSFVLFGGLKMCSLLRISEEAEEAGDVVNMAMEISNPSNEVKAFHSSGSSSICSSNSSASSDDQNHDTHLMEYQSSTSWSESSEEEAGQNLFRNSRFKGTRTLKVG